MFDFTSSKLLILGIVALLVIGPKELPALLRTLGKYMGIVRRHANDFRAQFDEAIRESELAELKKEVETIKQETEQAIQSVETTVQGEIGAVQGEIDAAKTGLDAALEDEAAKKFAADAMPPDTALLPATGGGGAAGTSAPLNGAGHPSEQEKVAAIDAPEPASGKTGA